MSFIRGEVGFQPGGSGEWADAVINRPLVTGDRLSTDRDARVELEIGAGSIRLDERSTFSLLNLDDRITQVELTDGTLNLSVRRLLDGQTYEVATPTLAFVVSEPGEYRIDVAPDGDSTIVTVFDGQGDVYGENDASYRVRDGSSYRFNDSRLRDYEVLDIPRADDFDRFCQERTRRYERAVSSRYVSDEVVGYADLDDYGSWSTAANYGSVWYPRGLRSDWAPYRDGHWAWIDPWGWSWVDDQPWGFAPSHYGRWANINNRWGWVPGPRHLRPVYAPALVAFVGGNNWGVSIGSNPVGWFPLGPRDVYRPWYDCSRDYFTRVNTRNTIITNVTVVNVYNDYSRGRPSRGDYAYRRDQRAFTAVPGDVFVGAQSVGRSRLRLSENVIDRGDLINAVAATPIQASLAARGNGRVHRPDADRLSRAVVALSAPPAQVLPFAQREAIIRDNGNRSPGMAKLRALDTAATQRADRRVRVVDADAKAIARDIPAGRAGAMNRRDASADARAEAANQASSRQQRELLRDTAGSRVGQGNADRMPSTRYSPAMRGRPSVDARGADIEQLREGRRAASQDRSARNNDSDAAGRVARQTQAVEQRRQAVDRQANARQQQVQAREPRNRINTPDAVDQPARARADSQSARQQRGRDVNADAQQGIEMPRRNAMQEQRRAQAVQQREQQAERVQTQGQRTDQSSRYQAQQMQRQQMQQDRQSRVQDQQAQVQQRQQQMQERQVQQQVQVQQRQREPQQRQVQQGQVQRQEQGQQMQAQRQQQQAQQMQMQRQQSAQQQRQPAPQKAQREQRKQQLRDANDAKEDQQNR